MNNNKGFVSGVMAMLASALCVALTCLLGKVLSESLALSLIVFIRFFCPFLLSAWMLLTIQQADDSLRWSWLHVLRAVFAVLGQYCLFYTLSFHSVLMATLLFSTGPLFVPIISYITQKTQINRNMLLSIGVGFVGVVCVLHPGMHGVWNWGLLLGLGAGFFNACSQVTFHKISQQKSPLAASFSLFGLGTVLALVPMLMSWHAHHIDHEFAYMLDSDLLLILIVFSLCSMSNQMFRSKAYQLVSKPSYLAPFWYMSIPFTAFLDWVLHGVLPDQWALAGCILVVLGGYLMLFHKHHVEGDGASVAEEQQAVADPNTGIVSLLQQRDTVAK